VHHTNFNLKLFSFTAKSKVIGLSSNFFSLLDKTVEKQDIQYVPGIIKAKNESKNNFI
jgi:hypothetical protein